MANRGPAVDPSLPPTETASLPPTINHERTDHDCGLDCVPNHSVEADVRVAQNNGLAVGGNNAVVVFGADHPESS